MMGKASMEKCRVKRNKSGQKCRGCNDDDDGEGKGAVGAKGEGRKQGMMKERQGKGVFC